jgi:hypothetical protein
VPFATAARICAWQSSSGAAESMPPAGAHQHARTFPRSSARARSRSKCCSPERSQSRYRRTHSSRSPSRPILKGFPHRVGRPTYASYGSACRRETTSTWVTNVCSRYGALRYLIGSSSARLNIALRPCRPTCTPFRQRERTRVSNLIGELLRPLHILRGPGGRTRSTSRLSGGY